MKVGRVGLAVAVATALSFGAARAAADSAPEIADGAAERTPDGACRGLDVRAFGAVGDDRTDDAAAIDEALRAAAESPGSTLCFPAGRYYLGTPITSRIDHPLRVIGAGDGRTLVRGDTAAPQLEHTLLRVAADITVRGMAFRDLDGIVVVMRGGSRLDRIELVGNRYRNVGSPLHWQDDDEHSSVATVLITGNSVRQAYRGFVVAPTAIGAARVEDNDIESVRYRGIQLGRDDARAQAHTGRLFVGRNTISDVREREGCSGKECEAVAVQVHGDGCFITGNHVARVTTSTGQDAEAIYVKCRSTDVSGNVLVDAGHREGYINVKGNNRARETRVATKPDGFGVTVRGNHLRCETRLPCRGIHVQTDDVVVAENLVEGPFETAIYTSDAGRRFENLVVAQNIVRQRGGDKALGFQHGGRGLQVAGNNLSVTDLSTAAIYIAPAAGESLEQVSVRGNLVAASGEGAFAAVLAHVRDRAGLEGLAVVDNDLVSDAAGVVLSGNGRWGAVRIAANRLSGVSDARRRLRVDTSSRFASFQARDNFGVRLRACDRIEVPSGAEAVTVRPGLARITRAETPDWRVRFTVTAVGATGPALLHWVEPLDDGEGGFVLHVGALPHETLAFAWCAERVFE
jgi:hypothetical protein